MTENEYNEYNRRLAEIAHDFTQKMRTIRWEKGVWKKRWKK